MNFFEELELTHYGSFELSRRVGPNLLKGLAVSFLIHSLVVASPFIVKLFQGNEEIPPPPLRVVDISQLTKLKRLQDTPDQIRIALPKLAAPKAMVPIAVDEDVIDTDANLMPSQAEIVNMIANDAGEEGLDLRPGEMIEIREEALTGDEIPEVGKFIPFEVAPQPLPDFSPAPAYPDVAMSAKILGKVIVWVYVDKAGVVKKYQIKSVIPKEMGFEESVIKVINKWKFTPAIQNGNAIGVWVEIPFTFQLED